MARRLIPGARYLDGPDEVVVEIAAVRRMLPSPAGVRTGRLAPLNVLLRYPDGRRVVRPFRGLRRPR